MLMLWNTSSISNAQAEQPIEQVGCKETEAQTRERKSCQSSRERKAATRCCLSCRAFTRSLTHSFSRTYAWRTTRCVMTRWRAGGQRTTRRTKWLQRAEEHFSSQPTCHGGS